MQYNDENVFNDNLLKCKTFYKPILPAVPLFCFLQVVHIYTHIYIMARGGPSWG